MPTQTPKPAAVIAVPEACPKPTDDAYLLHITRYIHLNPRQWRDYEYSSLPYYLQRTEESWLRPKRMLELFDGPVAYEQFVADYEENKKMIDILKHELANGY